MTARLIPLALLLTSCGVPQEIDCTDASTGFTLYDTSNNNPSEMIWGFTGTDKDGFTRTVPKQDAPRWKCRFVPRTK